MPLLETFANASVRGFGAFLPSAAGFAYEQIATAFGTGSSATITFSSIPQTYKHLQLRWVARQGNGDYWETFNFAANGANPTKGHVLYGNQGGERISQVSFYPGQVQASSASSTTTANIHGSGIATILDYANTTTNKTVRFFNGYNNVMGASEAVLQSKFFNSTSAITSITLDGWNGSNFTTTTRFSLYGIRG
jgi:hypothetical protein